MRTIEQIEAWAKKNPKRPDGMLWLGYSGSLVSRALESPLYFQDVDHALAKSELVSTDFRDAPAGAFHFWRTEYGHAGIDLDGGGTRILIADRRVTKRFGIGIGTLPIGVLTEPYIGWTLDFAGLRVASPALV